MKSSEYIKLVTIRPYEDIVERLNRENLIERIQIYGFIECENMLNFLSIKGEKEVLDIPSLKYLLDNLNKCLERHVNRYSDEAALRYFHELFVLRDEIEFVASISRK